MSKRSKLRTDISKAGFRTGELTAFDALLGMADKDTLIIPDSRQPKLSYLAFRAHQSVSRLKVNLAHLEKHGWTASVRGGGAGNPSRREVYFGKPCDCRPKPMTSTERTRLWRERQKNSGL